MVVYSDDPELEVFDLNSADEKHDGSTRRRTSEMGAKTNDWSLKLDTRPPPNKSHDSPPSAAPSIYKQLVSLLLQDADHNSGKCSHLNGYLRW